MATREKIRLHVSERIAELLVETATERAVKKVLMGRNENQRTLEVEHYMQHDG